MRSVIKNLIIQGILIVKVGSGKSLKNSTKAALKVTPEVMVV